MKISLELIMHAKEHVSESSDFGNMLGLMHADQSVDLLMKQRIIDYGISIFEKNNRCISFHKAIKIIGRRKIPLVSSLELIHSIRNQCQHLGIVITRGLCEYYVENAMYFIIIFIKNEYGMDYYELLGIEKPEGIGSGPGHFITQVFIDLVEKAKILYVSSKYTLANLSIFLAIENFFEFYDISPIIKRTEIKFGKYLLGYKNIIERLTIIYNTIILKNKAINSNNTNKKDVEYMISIIEDIEKIERKREM